MVWDRERVGQRGRGGAEERGGRAHIMRLGKRSKRSQVTYAITA